MDMVPIIAYFEIKRGGIISYAIKKIIDALGRISGIVEPERLELLHEAVRKFAQAA